MGEITIRQPQLDAVFLQDIGDRAVGNHVSQIGQCALNPPVTPVPILCRHAHNESR